MQMRIDKSTQDSSRFHKVEDICVTSFVTGVILKIWNARHVFSFDIPPIAQPHNSKHGKSL